MSYTTAQKQIIARALFRYMTDIAAEMVKAEHRACSKEAQRFLAANFEEVSDLYEIARADSLKSD